MIHNLAPCICVEVGNYILFNIINEYNIHVGTRIVGFESVDNLPC